MTLPNLITSLRIILVPLFIINLIHGGKITPSVISTMSTCMQMAAFFTVLSRAHFSFLSDMEIPIFRATGALTAGSGLHCMREWFHMMGEGSLNNRVI